MSRSKSENHWGQQRKMRAKAKVDIRRRDRQRLAKLTEDSGGNEPVPSRWQVTAIK